MGDIDMDKRNIIFGKITVLLVAFLVLLPGHVSQSAELTYTPINPSFGGNPFNSSHLIGLAEIQNQYVSSPSFSAGSAGLSQSDLFVRSLSSRLLSALAGQVTDAIFGDTPQESGTIVFGDVTVDFQRGLEFISLTIIDASTGSVTEVSVPILQDLP